MTAEWKPSGEAEQHSGRTLIHRATPGEKPASADARGYRPGKMIGDFRLVRLLGKGGMGTVWEAQQISLDRSVALKLIHPERMSARAIEFFHREGRAGGRLHHAGIVAVHAAGEADGVHFLAQELVEGECTLADFLRDMQSSSELPDDYFDRIADFFAALASAMQAAHDAGVIHRDLKPQNVLVTRDDQPKVTDFGLARIEDELSLSVTGEFAGTYYYMSPEQVTGKRVGIDHRSDIFSMGVMLYEAITLVRPFEGDTGQQVANKILFDDPTEPGEVRSRVPEEFAVIALKAMEKNPAQRFESMAELEADLRRYMRGEPIHARRPSALRRAQRWTRRHATASAVGAVITIALAVTAALWLENRSRGISLARANDELEREREALDLTNRELVAEREQLRVANTSLDRARRDAEELARSERERFQQVLRLAAHQDLDRLVREADALWPVVPALIPEYERWLEEARGLLAGLPQHREMCEAIRTRARENTPEEIARDLEEDSSQVELERVRARAAAAETELGQLVASGADLTVLAAHEEIANLLRQEAETLAVEMVPARRWRFDVGEDAWWHAELTRLIDGIEDLAHPEHGLLGSGVSETHGWGMQHRLELARRIEASGDDARLQWAAARASIQADERFEGFELAPQVGLLPLGRSPQSGLWEFWHIASGERPIGEPDQYAMTEASGLVLVLLPPGTFARGAQRQAGALNSDPHADLDESPVHRIRLEPFFISKHEMTQAQWERIAGRNPSDYGPGGPRSWSREGHSVDRRHPVEQTTWSQCRLVLERLGLTLPTETQWEYAARGGTSTPWWTGSERETVQGAANLKDSYMRQTGGSQTPPFEEWLDDGYTMHAPVDALRPNDFGLHNVMGNVWEWCDGVYESYGPSADGESLFPAREVRRLLRGGAFNSTVVQARSANRMHVAPGTALNSSGVRPARPVDP